MKGAPLGLNALVSNLSEQPLGNGGPVPSMHTSPANDRGRADPGDPTRVRVVLADDDARFRESLATLLEVDPLVDVVGVASNGADAVALATSLSPDIVIMDISMPRMDGFEATRRIHELDGAPFILVLTASDDVEDVDRARRAGAGGFLKKRHEIVELVGLIVSFTSLVGQRGRP